MSLPTVNSFTNWGKLKEVWLGDVYPSHFYDHLESQVRDVFYELTEKTQADLNTIQSKLQEFGVDVVRPEYHKIDDFISPDWHPHHPNTLLKPQITPRDHFLAHGNKLFYPPWLAQAWQPALDRYAADAGSQLIPEIRLEHLGSLSGANTVRVGKDLYLDVFHVQRNSQIDLLQQEFDQKIKPYFADSRLHLLNNGGHVDACFAAIKPGLLLTSRYFSDYDRTFPGWEQINIAKPEFSNNQHGRNTPGANGKFWLAGASNNQAFNDHVIKHALDWVGNYTETYFEVNCLVVDEKNVLMLGENKAVFRALEKFGITAHSLPFRTRTFWDGGLHCLTLDIRREDLPVDLFPSRDQSVYYYS